MSRISAPRLALLALPLLAALPAQAQVARQFSSATYTGLGGSQVSTDYHNLKDAINLDAIGGFRIVPAQKWGSLSAELNISISVSPGKNEGVPSGTGGVIGGGGTADCGKCTSDPDDFASQNFSLLATYRTPGRFYGLGQAGYSLSLTSIDEIEEHGRGGFSYGGGIGFRFGQETAAVEVLYQQVSEALQTIGIRLIY